MLCCVSTATDHLPYLAHLLREFMLRISLYGLLDCDKGTNTYFLCWDDILVHTDLHTMLPFCSSGWKGGVITPEISAMSFNNEELREVNPGPCS